jgi:hypothetical protein
MNSGFNDLPRCDGCSTAVGLASERDVAFATAPATAGNVATSANDASVRNNEELLKFHPLVRAE